MRRFSQATEGILRPLLLATTFFILLFPELSIAQESEAPLKVLPPEMADEIYNKLARTIDEQMHQHRTMFEWAVWIFGILLAVTLGGAVFAGYGRIDEIKNELLERVNERTSREALVAQIRTTVDAEISQRLLEVDRTIERMRGAEDKFTRETKFFSFKQLVRDIDKSESYTKDQLDEAMRYVRQFNDEILEDSVEEANSVLRTLTNKLFRSNRIAELRSIEEMFPELVKSDVVLRNRMIETYTLRVFEHFATPEDVDRFHVYLRSAWEAGYGESALAEELLLLYKEMEASSERRAEADRLYELAEDFNSAELGNFLNSLAANTSADLLSSNPRARHRAIEIVGKEVVLDNKKIVSKLLEKLLAESPDSLRAGPISHLATLLAED